MALMQGDREQMVATVAFTKAQTAAVLPIVTVIHQRLAMASMQVCYCAIMCF